MRTVLPVMAPIIFAAIGTNTCDRVTDEYLLVFLSAAAFAAAPEVWDV